MNNQNLRLTDINATIMDVAIAMGGGNPGGLRVTLDLIQKGGAIDPQAFDGIAHVLTLDVHGIYAHRIWMLYKDVCGEDLARMIAVLRAVQLGIIDTAELDHAIDNRGAGLDVDSTITAVKQRLPDLKVEVPSVEVVA